MIDRRVFGCVLLAFAVACQAEERTATQPEESRSAALGAVGEADSEGSEAGPARTESAPVLDDAVLDDTGVPARVESFDVSPAVPTSHIAKGGEEAEAQEQSSKEQDSRFLANAFPPTLSDTDYHEDAWVRLDCLRCHETAVGEAPPLVHEGMTSLLLEAKCRTCHVVEPGRLPNPHEADPGPFLANSFPPMIPASASHPAAWGKDDCRMCHDTGVRGAPLMEHKNLPPILQTAKCRTCHVQVRVLDVSDGAFRR